MKNLLLVIAFGLLMMSPVHTDMIPGGAKDLSPAHSKILTDARAATIYIPQAASQEKLEAEVWKQSMAPDTQLPVFSMGLILGTFLLVLAALGFRRKIRTNS